jgi:hypothetical protein
MRTVLYLGEMCDGDFDSGTNQRERGFEWLITAGLIECEELKRLLRNGHPLTRYNKHVHTFLFLIFFPCAG